MEDDISGIEKLAPQSKNATAFYHKVEQSDRFMVLIDNS